MSPSPAVVFSASLLVLVLLLVMAPCGAATGCEPIVLRAEARSSEVNQGGASR